jgi:excisionase family DNA binding protein
MFYTIKEAANQLGITYATLQGQIFQGRIQVPAMRVGSRSLFTADEIQAAKLILSNRCPQRKEVQR